MTSGYTCTYIEHVGRKVFDAAMDFGGRLEQLVDVHDVIEVEKDVVDCIHDEKSVVLQRLRVPQVLNV